MLEEIRNIIREEFDQRFAPPEPAIVDKSTLVTERGSWLITDPNTPEHAFDTKLASAISIFMQLEECTSILDLGCGLGTYCDYIKNKGIYSINMSSPVVN